MAVAPKWYVGRVTRKLRDRKALVRQVSDRVGGGFRVVGHGEIGEYSNGALLVKLAEIVGRHG